MDAATIFVLCLAGAFFGLIVYLAFRRRKLVTPAKEETRDTRRAA
jgi:hypothetical protein